MKRLSLQQIANILKVTAILITAYIIYSVTF
jgi:hypothetical protein